MELKQHYNQIMTECVTMALATSVDNRPNVRIVTFGYTDKQQGKLYFSTFKGNQKTKEFAQNPHVACMPLPVDAQTMAQVRIFGKVQRSSLSLDEMIEIISHKSPEDAATLKEGGDMLEIYEVSFAEAWITVGMNQAECYSTLS